MDEEDVVAEEEVGGVHEGGDVVEVDLGDPEGEGSSLGEEEERRAPRSLVDWGSCNLRDSDVDRLIFDFHIPPPFDIYTPVPSSRPPSPPDNCLSFFVAQLRSGLHFLEGY
ncbi:UNVERIFIED_CONTAM: hypothetical protein Slati_1935100 [Sesamum latifolium]|uniref:Uncharacterized protein n=1 Tax=Sesamum latifolium TaxID=2727402 RepID=A0AAW2X1Y6_9LAMI